MTETSLTNRGNRSFEELKKLTDHGAEYWTARELQPLLGYGQWRRFENAIKKAITSCQRSGNNPDHHFADAGKMIEIGKGGSGELCPKISLQPNRFVQLQKESSLPFPDLNLKKKTRRG